MVRRRPLAIISSVAALVAGLGLAAPAADAAPAITPWSTTVAVGASFSASANGCPTTEDEGETSYTYQQAQLRLLVGSGPSQRLAAFGEIVSGVRLRFSVPGWVDPGEDAVIVGSCVRTTYSFDDGAETTTTRFTYPAVAIDIVAGTPTMTGPVVSLSRTSVAAGQGVRVTITGCEGASYASATLLAGGDLTLPDPQYVIGNSAEVIGGTATIDLLLVRHSYDVEEGGLEAIDEGDYVVVGSCYVETEQDSIDAVSAPVVLNVGGTTPWASVTYEVEDSAVSVSGTGCDGGRTVTVTSTTETYDYVGDRREHGRAVAQLDLARAALTAPSAADGPESTTIDVTPAADGSWTTSVPVGDDQFYVLIAPACGDPLADGFAYASRTFFLGGPYADVYTERVSPTSSPVGGQIAAYVSGDCESGAQVSLYPSGSDVPVATSSTVVPGWDMPSKVTLTAPSTPGTYELGTSCDGRMGDSSAYEVFTPTTLAGEAPLPAEPTEGWPSQGRREVYHGKIGPITLPPMASDGDPMEDQGTRALGPSGLFIDIPRPDGDFAITKIDMDLVDAEGMSVPATSAHLHHFVFGAADGKNPGCPNGSTFGIPGSIIGAAGAEKTVLQIDDPYGVVVHDEDDWKGVYELMSRSSQTQQVYLTYDITYRRDVQNVRPVVRYFGSATGCSTFTWTLDGSGIPDTQSTYIDIAKSGRLVGGGAHVHNGASYADIVDDRGRRLCRSEITYGTHEVGHGMPMLKRAMDDATTTTMDVGMPIEAYPPEFYDDDLEIASISNCALSEAVTAGERIRFDTVYANDRSRSGVMGIYSLFVWEGGGPATPGPAPAPGVPGDPSYTG